MHISMPPNREPREEFMTVKQVATMMQVAPKTVRRWIKLGRLTPVRMGLTIRVRRSAVMTAIERSRDEQPPAKDDPAMW